MGKEQKMVILGLPADVIVWTQNKRAQDCDDSGPQSRKPHPVVVVVRRGQVLQGGPPDGQPPCPTAQIHGAVHSVRLAGGALEACVQARGIRRRLERDYRG